MNHPKRTSLEKKLAAAVSVVGLLNAGAPVALPYVNVARNLCAAGGEALSLPDAIARTLCATAHAGTSTAVPRDGVTSETVAELNDGDQQTVSAGGTGTVGLMNSSGSQQIAGGGAGTITTMQLGEQQVFSGATGSIGTIMDGQQIVQGGTAYAERMEYGGTSFQDINFGSGHVDTVAGGTQRIWKGARGDVSFLAGGGEQYIKSGGTGSVTSMTGGTMVIDSGGIVKGDVVGYGTVVGELKLDTGRRVAAQAGKRGDLLATGPITASLVVVRDGAWLEAAGDVNTERVFMDGEPLRDEPLVSAAGSASFGTLNVEGLRLGLQKHLTLVSARSVPESVKVLYDAGEGVLTADNPLTLLEKDDVTTRTRVPGVSLTYDAIRVIRNRNNRVIEYTADNLYKSATLDAMQWTSGGPGYVFEDGSRIVEGGLEVYFAGLSVAGVKEAADGESMNFLDLTNATDGFADLTGKLAKVNERLVFLKDMKPEGKDLLTLQTKRVDTLATDEANRVLTYTVGTTKTQRAVFDGTMAWKNGDVYYDGANRPTFDEKAKLALANLDFSFDNDAADALASGSAVTLIKDAGATAVIESPAPASHTVTRTGANTTLTATATGAAAIGGADLEYTMDEVTLDHVAVTAVTDTTDNVPAGWTPNAAGVVVDTDGFTAGAELSADAKTLLSAKQETFFDENIVGANKYVQGKVFSNTLRGVTVSGTWSHGVKASEDHMDLLYDPGDLTAAAVTLGEMKWQTPRTFLGKCDFSQASVDAAGLHFDFTGEEGQQQAANLAADRTSDLMTNAAGLPSGLDVKGANHTQTVPYAAANGAALTAALTGTVSATRDHLGYTVKTIDLTNVDLAGWDCKTSAAVPWGWTVGEAGVTVRTDGFTAETERAGTTRTILTHSEGAFSDDNIFGANKYAVDRTFDDTANGVNIKGTWSHGVYAADDDGNHVEKDGSRLVYDAGDLKAKSVTLGEMKWQTPRELLGQCDFSAAAADAGGLRFAFTNDEAEALKAGATSDLMPTAAGLPAGLPVTDADRRQAVPYTAKNGAALTAALTGTVSAAKDHLGYTVETVELTNVDLAGWNGTDEAAAPGGWTVGETGAAVRTDGFDARTERAGTTQTVLTAPAGTFSDDNIFGANKYAVDRNFDDTAKGVNIKGTWSHGVKASADGAALLYDAGDLRAKRVTLGEMKWQTPRELLGQCDFTAAAVDASALRFAFTNDEAAALKAGAASDLMTKAAGLPAGLDIVGAAHTQAVPYTAKNGAALTATLAGTVSAQEASLGYAADSVTATQADISKWDTETASLVPGGWTGKGVAVVSDNDFPATAERAGKTQVILAASEGFFSDAAIGENIRYKENREFDDTEKGVAIRGTWSRGVKSSADGAALLYDAGDLRAGSVLFGDMKWQTPRELLGQCDFTAATLDASSLVFSFTNDEAAALRRGDITSLMTKAAGLPGGRTVTGADRVQDVAYTASNKAAMTATLTGTVAAQDESVEYTVDRVRLKNVDIAAWDAETTSAVPLNWQKVDAVTVSTDGFVPTAALAGSTRAIVTAHEGGTFADENISGENAYKADKPFSDTEKGVTVSGIWSRGVRADETGSVLLYDADDINADTVILGEVTWSDPRVVKDRYDFTNVGAIDARPLTFTNPAVIPVGSVAALLTNAANLAAGLPAVYAQGTTHTQTIEGYDVPNGVTLDATLTGTVSTEADTVNYKAESIELTGADIAGWDGKTAAAVPRGWTGSNVAVSTDGFAPAADLAGTLRTILTANEGGTFADGSISGENRFDPDKPFSDTEKGVTVSGIWPRGVRADDTGAALIYDAARIEADTVALGEVTWNDPRVMLGKCDFTKANDKAIDARSLTFTDPAVIPVGSVAPLLLGAANLAAGLPAAYAQGAKHTQDIAGYTVSNGATLDATLTGTVTTAAGTVNYNAESIQLTGVDLAGWDGRTASDVPKGWTGTKTPVKTDGFTVTDDLMAGVSLPILNATAGVFDDSAIGGGNKYGTVTGDSTKNGVTLTGSVDRGVKAGPEGASLLYVAGKYDISGIAVGPDVVFAEGGVLRAASGTACDYTKTTAVDVSAFSLANPTEVAGGRSMTLLAANATLADIAAQTKEQAYSVVPVPGVSLAGRLTGDVFARGGFVTYRAAENRAESLTFDTVEWKDSGALMNRPEAIVFDGAAVDTSTINFTGITSIDGQKTMTLVANFDGTPGSITGDTYHIGTGISGRGRASVAGSDLIFTAESSGVDPKTHALLMGLGAAMQSLEVGNAFIGDAAEGLALASNIGADGIATFAKMGGGSLRQETGSHIDVRTWNAIIALGRNNEKETGTTEYGAFFEYGTGNYTAHDGADRGDGSMSYTGGGLLAKWRAKSGLYVEGSARAGHVRGDSRNVLRDGMHVPYTCDINSPYMGAHIGFGRELAMEKGDVLDVYGKYFYNRRESTSFDAGGHYDLDDLSSQILRVGARYTMKREKWNFYGGLAYDHEFDGKATGKVNGLDIRGVDMSGGSLRLELGAAMQPSENAPWSLDLNLTGFAGKKQGLMGGLSVAYLF